MTKRTKKDKVSASVALFDDFLSEESKKSDKKKKSTAKSKSVKDKSKSDKSDDIHKSKSRSTSASKHSKSDTSVQTKKQSRTTGKNKQSATSNAVQKSKTDKRAVSKSDDSTVKRRTKPVNNRKSNKDGANTGKKRSTTVKSTADSRKAAGVTKRSRKSEDTEPRLDTKDDANIKEAKKYWRKHRYDRSESISQPRAITGKPKQIADDFSLVSIMVDGKYLEVSPWSIVRGIYHPGLDSNFIVNRLSTDGIKSHTSVQKKKEKKK